MAGQFSTSHKLLEMRCQMLSSLSSLLFRFFANAEKMTK